MTWIKLQQNLLVHCVRFYIHTEVIYTYDHTYFYMEHWSVNKRSKRHAINSLWSSILKRYGIYIFRQKTLFLICLEKNKTIQRWSYIFGLSKLRNISIFRLGWSCKFVCPVMEKNWKLLHVYFISSLLVQIKSFHKLETWTLVIRRLPGKILGLLTVTLTDGVIISWCCTLLKYTTPLQNKCKEYIFFSGIFSAY